MAARSQSANNNKWRLETDTRTDEERKRDRAEWKRERRASLVSALTMGCVKADRATMDSNIIQEKLDGRAPRCGLNAAFVWEVSGLEPPKDLGEFDLKRLFEAVASGDVTKLAGLEAYLRRTAKGLSDSDYQRNGKTVLMTALLNMREEKSAMVEYLLDVSERTGDIRDLVNAAYTDVYYKGQTALHIAIERRSIGYVRKLVESGTDVHARACGKFFQQPDEPSFYFGELPLSLAACTNQPQLVDFLLDNEHQVADVTQADSRGNTVLHALVAVADNTPENTEFVTRMYDHVLTLAARLTPDAKLEDARNDQGLTSLKMAAKTGKIGLLAHILRREFSDEGSRHLSRKFTEWVYGPIHTSLYDLEALDTYGDNMSALEIIVYGSDTPNRPQMLEVEPLSGLLEDKWRRFAGRLFLFHVVVYVAYLTVFTVVAFNKMDAKPPFPIVHSSDGYVYVMGQLLITLASFYFVIRGILDLVRKRPKPHTLLIDGYYDVLFCVQGVFFLACAALYLAGDVQYLGLLVLSLLLGWVNLLYFFRGNKHMGVYSVLIQKVLLEEIFPFLFVYMVFLFGFSAAIVALLMDPVSTPSVTVPNKSGRKGDGGCQRASFQSISFTMLELFKFAIGIGQVEFAENHGKSSYDNVIFYILLIIYIILTFILLLNMLIALMSKTVERTTVESTSIWRLQRAIATLDMERGLPACLKSRLRCGVDVKLGSKQGCVDNRHCFRVEEVDWKVWNSNVGISREEPIDWNQGSYYASMENKRRHGFFKDRSTALRKAKPKQLRKQQNIDVIV